MPLQIDFYPLETFEDVQDAQQLNESGSFDSLGEPGFTSTTTLPSWAGLRIVSGLKAMFPG